MRLAKKEKQWLRGFLNEQLCFTIGQRLEEALQKDDPSDQDLEEAKELLAEIKLVCNVISKLDHDLAGHSYVNQIYTDYWSQLRDWEAECFPDRT